jgi:hypothetical protein
VLTTFRLESADEIGSQGPWEWSGAARRAPSCRPFPRGYQGTCPFWSWKVPVGPSASAVVRRTTTLALSSGVFPTPVTQMAAVLVAPRR